MKEFIAACVQIAIQPNDVNANIEKSIHWLEKAANEYDADLVVFPETITTGFDPALDAFALYDLVDAIPGRVSEPIQRAAKALGVHVVWPTYSRG
ncbi:MAG: carbon-nitrogen hydrolase family protein, partial [Chloroflexi bacterium]|nr:carbon-nitrogen hydrolase family protein [Chloroflexota bacterium]